MWQLDPGVAVTLLGMLVVGIGAFFTLQQRQSSFEKSCGEQIGRLETAVTGVNERLDEKLDPVIAFMNQEIGARRARATDQRRHGTRASDDIADART